LTFDVTAYNDPDGNTVQIQFDWNNDADYADTGEALQNVTGPTPVPFNSPIFYNNPTLTPGIRNVPYRYTDGIVAPITGTGQFTLGPNQAPTFAGTVGLQNSTLAEPATFQLTTSGFSVSDPEGDALSFTVTADANNNGSVEQTASNVLSLSGYNAAPVMGPWGSGSSDVRFRAYVNDALHAGTSGTALTTSPSPLLGTISSTPCGLSMAAVNTTLASLTTGNVVRADTAPDQVITGIRVGWTDIAGELEYVVQRATWADGATIGSLAFSNLATVAANTTSYDDTTVNTQGTRYLYRVAPRCVVGSTTVGTPSQLAMVALQDFEGLAAGTNLITSPNLGNGWTVNYTHSANQTATISSGANALNGARSAEVTEANQGATNAALTLSPPHINDRAALGTITVSRFEMEHALANSAQQNVGYSILTNTGRFTNGTTTAPLAPNNWRWIPTSGASSAGLGYNDNTNTAMTTLFSNISGQIGASNFNWGVGPLGESYTALDATVGTITNAHDYLFIAAASATSNPDENMRFDDVAWIVY
ncbi:MAG TPA: hypothetical protein VEI97_11650, partial [bacterium]|nr:hypothetical protein [bacterium]